MVIQKYFIYIVQEKRSECDGGKMTKRRGRNSRGEFGLSDKIRRRSKFPTQSFRIRNRVRMAQNVYGMALYDPAFTSADKDHEELF